MVAPLILFLVSVLGFAVGVLSGWGDAALLALPCALASLFLLLQAWRAARRAARGVARGADSPLDPLAKERVRPQRIRRGRPEWVIVDGSNVLYWKDGVASIEPVRDVVAHLTAQGFTPGVVFDANAGYKIADRYLHHYAMAKQLGLPEDRVMVVPKGTQADPIVLEAARDQGARVVSNDRFRDRTVEYPEITKPGTLIRGGYRDGQLWLSLDAEDKG